MKLFKSTHISVALSLLLLTACKQDQQDKPSTAVSQITINNAAEPESLDPHKVSGVPESNILRQLLVGLTSTDLDGQTIPGMASEWSSPDNKVWTFKLRDAKWSNGDAVTAHDFVYSFRRLIDPNTASPYISYLSDLKVLKAADIEKGLAKPDSLGVVALDDKTLQITLSDPVPYFDKALSHTSLKPVHQKTIEKFGDKWTAPENIVVNGAYRLSQWQVNERIVIERNPHYYDNQNTSIEKAVILPITDPATDVAHYLSGETDITETLPPEQYDKLKKDHSDQIKVLPLLCTYYYQFNHTKAPFDDVRVRQALTMTIERDIIVNSILKQGQKPAYQFTPESTAGNISYQPYWQDWDQPKRIAEAKRLLNEAGFNENNPLSFELLYNTNEQHKNLAVAVDSFWRQALGFVNVSLVNQEWKTYLETRRKNQFDMMRAAWCADYNEPSSFLNIYQSNNSNNHGKYSSPAFDAIMKQTLRPDVTDAQRSQLYHDAEKELSKDSAAIFVYQYSSPRLVRPYISGYSDKDPMNNWQLKNMKIQTK